MLISGLKGLTGSSLIKNQHFSGTNKNRDVQLAKSALVSSLVARTQNQCPRFPRTTSLALLAPTHT